MANYNQLSGLNWDRRMIDEVKGLIFHHTGGRGDPAGVINTLNQRGFGAQYIMDRQGNIYATAPQGARMAHMRPGQGPGAGLSNANALGIEMIAKNNADLTQAQINAGLQFIQQQQQLYPNLGIFGHGEVNPHKQATEGSAVVAAWRAGQRGVVGGAAPQQVAMAEPPARPQYSVGPGFSGPNLNAPVMQPLSPPQQRVNPYMQAIFGQGPEDWLQNKSYSMDALAADFFAGRNPLRRLVYQKLFG